MIRKIKNAASIIIYYSNIILAPLLALSSLAPLFNPAKWWMISLLGLIFPVLLILAVSFFIAGILLNFKKNIIFLLAILISIPAILNSFAFNNHAIFRKQKEPGSIRLITWNVGLMNFTGGDTKTSRQQNQIIFNKLKELNADVICLQEFFTCIIPGNYYNLIDSVSKTLGYPYHFFSRDIPYFSEQYFSGSIIFSKYKITDNSRTVFPNAYSGAVIKANLLIDTDTIDIFTTRLQSLYLKNSEYPTIHNLKKPDEKEYTVLKTVLRKLKLAYRKRTAQINILDSLLIQSKYALIFTGDLNDVPVSYTYSKIKMNMSDAWIKKGAGLGRTFRFISPTLRIDHIFFNNFFKASQVNRIITDSASDHYGLVSDLVLIKKRE